MTTEALLVIGGGSATLIGKIVWDWLKNRQNGEHPCQFSHKIEKLEQDTETVKLDLVEVKTDVKWIKQKLES